MKHAINWFAIPVIDMDRAVQFYNDIFQFEMQLHEMGGVTHAFFPIQEADGIGGHLFPAKNMKPCLNGRLIFLNGGNDLQDILSRVDEAGGEILEEKALVSDDIGYVAHFVDSEGNRMALHSPN